MSRSFEDYVTPSDSNRQTSNQTSSNFYDSTQQSAPTGGATTGQYAYNSQDSALPSTQPVPSSYSNQSVGTALSTDRPIDTRTTSFGVTPASLKSGPDAHNWSEQAITDISQVSVETPRPSELGSQYNKFDDGAKSYSTSGNQTGSGQPQSTYENIKDTASSVLPSTGNRDGGPSAYERAKDTVTSALPSTGNRDGQSNYDSTKQSTQSTYDSAKQSTQSTYDSTKQSTQSTYDSAKQSVNSSLPSTTNEKGEGLYERAKNTVSSALPSTTNKDGVSAYDRTKETVNANTPAAQTVFDKLKSVGAATYDAAANAASQTTQYLQQTVAEANASQAGKTDTSSSGYTRQPGQSEVVTDTAQTAHKSSDQSSSDTSNTFGQSKPTSTSDLSSNPFKVAQETYDESPLGGQKAHPTASSNTNPFTTGSDPLGQTALGSNNTSAPPSKALKQADQIFSESRQENPNVGQAPLSASSFGRTEPQSTSQSGTDDIDLVKKIPGGW